MAVFVLDKRKRPLMPCAEKRARQLLDRGQAVVHTLRPFTIRLRDRVGGETQSVEIRLDPGSKSTGVAVVRKGDLLATVSVQVPSDLNAEAREAIEQYRKAMSNG